MSVGILAGAVMRNRPIHTKDSHFGYSSLLNILLVASFEFGGKDHVTWGKGGKLIDWIRAGLSLITESALA